MAHRGRDRIDRRSFLHALGAGTVAVGAGTLAAGAAAAPAHAQHGAGKGPPAFPPGRIGLQTWSIRDKIPELGFPRLFEELSDIGYRQVEFHTYEQGEAGPITVEEIRRALDDNGLRAVASHRSISAFRNTMEQELDWAETLGLKYIGTGSPPVDWGGGDTVDEWRAAAEEFNSFGEAAAARGLKLYQHNHEVEFGFASDDPGARLWDIFLENTDPELVYLELDIYWAYVGRHLFGGFEPVDYVLADPKRFPLFHIKDGVENPDSTDGYDMIEFGAGDLAFREFFCALQRNGIRKYEPLWEQDNAAETAVPPHELDSLGNAERSYEAMRALRLGPKGGR